MKRMICIVLICIVNLTISSEEIIKPELITKFESVRFLTPSMPVYAEGGMLFGGRSDTEGLGTFLIDFDTNSYSKVYNARISDGARFFESKLYSSQGYSHGYVEPETGNFVEYNDYPSSFFWGDNKISGSIGLFYPYQNDWYIVQSMWGSEETNSSVKLVNIHTGESELLVEYWNFQGLTNDKMHILLKSHRELAIYNIQSRAIVQRFKMEGSARFNASGSLLSNNLLIGPSMKYPFWEVYSINGSKICSLDMDGFAEYTPDRLYFSSDLKKAISSDNQVFNMLSLANYLESLDLLFHQTTGRSTVNRLRVRENPNLEAQIYGFLSAGDEVEVLDRSGIQVEIGDMMDYWYKIRNAEGLEGWAYGFFLELDEPAEDEE